MRTLETDLDIYMVYLKGEKGLAKNTLEAYSHDLALFLDYCLGEGVTASRRIGREHLLEFVGRRREGGVSPRTAARNLIAVRGFLKFLLMEEVIDEDPAELVGLPKKRRKLPGYLSEEEVDRLLAAPETSKPIGLRDAAMLELLYATGLRVSELVTLKMEQVNLDVGYLRARGKGGKERIVPFTKSAAKLINDYRHGARDSLLKGCASDFLFVSRLGGRMTRQNFWARVSKWALRAGINKRIYPHLLRHSFATHLMNHGAGLSVVQKLLGHTSLSTTEIYTHVNREQLKKLHKKIHPRG